MKPKLLMALLICVLCASLYADDFIIGTGTSTENYVPLYAYNSYSWSKMLFTNTEFAGVGLTASTTIKKIALYVGNTVPGFVTNNQIIYMGVAYDNSYGSVGNSYPSTAGYTQVFNGSITWTGPGWMEIILDTPYTYNPTWNLEVLWENRDGSGASGYPKFAYTSTSSNYRAVYKYSNTSFPASTGGTRYYNRPNVWFMSDPTDVPPPASALIPSAGAADVGVDTNLRWVHNGGSPDSYRVYVGTDNPPSNVVNGTVVTTTSFDIPVYLNYESTYYWRIVPHNNFGYAFDCPVWSFTTVNDPTIYTFPWTESFDGTFPGTNWRTHSGALTDPVVLGADGSGLWEQDDWLNISGTDKAARINIWANVNGWLVTPPLHIANDYYQLQFDLALLKYNQPPTGTQPDQDGLDDRFVVLIGDGWNWSTANILREWNNAGSQDVLNSIPTSGQTFQIPLAGHTGDVRIAFWCGSVDTNADNDVMLNNVMVNQVLAMPAVTITRTETNGILSMNWNQVTGATQYRILSSENPSGTYTEIGLTTETQFNVTGNAIRHFFRVIAVSDR